MRDEIGAPASPPAPDGSMDGVLQNVDTAAEWLRAIGSPHRLMILCLLAERERTVTELRRRMGVRQSLVSQHLARLRELEIVEAQRQANRAIYRLTDKASCDLITLLDRPFGGGERGAAK